MATTVRVRHVQGANKTWNKCETMDKAFGRNDLMSLSRIKKVVDIDFDANACYAIKSQPIAHRCHATYITPLSATVPVLDAGDGKHEPAMYQSKRNRF